MPYETFEEKQQGCGKRKNKNILFFLKFSKWGVCLTNYKNKINKTNEFYMEIFI